MITAELAAALARAEKAASSDRYEEAEEAFAESLRLNPKNVPAWHRRARMRLLRGLFEEAASDLAEAVELAPSDPQLSHHLAQARVHAGLPLKRPPVYWRGVLAAREGRLKAARKHFDKAAEPRAAWLSWICRAREGARPGGPSLVLVGLGYQKMVHMTVEGARALEGRARYAAVCNVIDDDVMDLLALYEGKLIPVLFRGSEQEARAAAQAVLSLKGRVGLVTRGHPLVYGQLAELIVQGAPDCAVHAAVSGFEVLSALAGTAGLGELQVKGAFDVDSLDPRKPAVVYFPGERAALEKACGTLAALYEECWLMPNAGPREFAPVRLSVKSLAGEAAGQLPCAAYFSPL